MFRMWQRNQVNEVPVHLLTRPTSLAKSMGHGDDTVYRTMKSTPYGRWGKLYAKEVGLICVYYKPTDRGLEKKINDKFAWLSEIGRSESASALSDLLRKDGYYEEKLRCRKRFILQGIKMMLFYDCFVVRLAALSRYGWKNRIILHWHYTFQLAAPCWIIMVVVLMGGGICCN